MAGPLGCASGMVSVRNQLWGLQTCQKSENWIDHHEAFETLGMKPELEQSTKVIKAPMPGKVQSIEVEEGNQVQEGETILVLEAMKMENEIKSPIQGRIKTIQVELGQTIDKQTLLVELE